MTANDNAFCDVLSHLKKLSSGIAGGRFITAWSKIGDDTVVTVVSTADDGDTMTVRISDDVAMLDVNSSDAIEFSSESEDIDVLMRVVDAFFSGELDIIVGDKDGKCYGVRVGKDELVSSIGLIDRLRSGKRRLRSIK